MTYKRIDKDTAYREADGMEIRRSDTPEWRDYIAWCAAGNTPDHATAEDLRTGTDPLPAFSNERFEVEIAKRNPFKPSL
jgi:hypothetical protein